MEHLDGPVDGFALPEYLVPRTLPKVIVPALGTIAKASTKIGSIFAEGERAATAPGPGHYSADAKGRKILLGVISKPEKAEKDRRPKTASASVGQYNIISAMTTPRIRGGTMSKRARGCIFSDKAEREKTWKPSPGLYNAQSVLKHLTCPTFSEKKTSPSQPKKPSPVGPGYYNLNFIHVEEQAPYTSPRVTKPLPTPRPKSQEKPPPGPSIGLPDSKIHDFAGQQRHIYRLLTERQVTPRREIPLMGTYGHPKYRP